MVTDCSESSGSEWNTGVRRQRGVEGEIGSESERVVQVFMKGGSSLYKRVEVA